MPQVHLSCDGRGDCGRAGLKRRVTCRMRKAARTHAADCASLRIRPTKLPGLRGAAQASSIQMPMPNIIRFSVKETKPRGTFESPPTQAHLSSRFWI